MKVTSRVENTSLLEKFVSFIKDLLGALITIILLILISPFLLANKEKKSSDDINSNDLLLKKEKKKLKWNRIINKESIKVEEAFVFEGSEDEGYKTFYDEYEYVKKLRTIPEISELENYYFSDFFPYEIDKNYYMLDSGIFLIALSNDDKDEEASKLLFLNFEQMKVEILKENLLWVDEVKWLDDYAVEFITNTYETKEITVIEF